VVDLGGAGNVVDEDATLQLKLIDALTRRPFEDRVALLVLLTRRPNLLAAKDDALEEIDIVLALVLALDDDEGLLEEKFAERSDIVALPVFDTVAEVVDGLKVFLATSLLVDLLRHSHDRVVTRLELVVVLVIFRRVLEEGLQGEMRSASCTDREDGEEARPTPRSKGYLHIRWTGLMRRGASSETGSRTCESFCKAETDLIKIRERKEVEEGTNRKGSVLSDSEFLRSRQVGTIRLVDRKVLLHRQEQPSKPLLLRSHARILFNTDEEPPLEVGELVEVDEEAVDLILGEDVVHLNETLVLLLSR
jgi:hypothetical protein